MNERRLGYQAGSSEPLLGHGVVTSEICESRTGPAVTVSEGQTDYAMLSWSRIALVSSSTEYIVVLPGLIAATEEQSIHVCCYAQKWKNDDLGSTVELARALVLYCTRSTLTDCSPL